MSTVSQFFLGGPHFTDPRWLPKGYGESGQMGMSNSAVSFDYFSAANGWTYLGNFGTAVDTGYSADTFKTLLSVSTQAGYVAGMVGPKMTTATDTTTFRITVDGGSAVSIAIVGAGTNVRCFLGFPITRALYTTADTGAHGYPLASDKMRVAVAPAVNSEGIFLPVQRALAQGMGLLRFTSSLLVECKTTQTQTGAGSQERQSGVIWQRMY